MAYTVNLWATIASMWLPLTVLTVAGVSTLGLGWWLAVKAEGRDEWILGMDDTSHGTATVLARRDQAGVVHIVSSTYEPKETTR